MIPAIGVASTAGRAKDRIAELRLSTCLMFMERHLLGLENRLCNFCGQACSRIAMAQPKRCRPQAICRSIDNWHGILLPRFCRSPSVHRGRNRTRGRFLANRGVKAAGRAVRFSAKQFIRSGWTASAAGCPAFGVAGEPACPVQANGGQGSLGSHADPPPTRAKVSSFSTRKAAQRAQNVRLFSGSYTQYPPHSSHQQEKVSPSTSKC